MNDFRICFKSVSGWITGYLRPMTDLSSAPSYGDPVYPASGFTLWQPFSDGVDTDLTWNQYYKPCTNNMRGMITPKGVAGLCNTEGATSHQTAATVIEIQLHDQYDNPIPSPSLVLKVYNDNNINIRFFMQKKEISGGTITYTDASVERALEIPSESAYYDRHVYIVAGTITTGGHLGYGCGFIDNFIVKDTGEMAVAEGNIFVASETGFKALMDSTMPQETEADPDLGPESEPGGYGPGDGGSGGTGGPGPTFDDSSDPFTPSPLPPGISQLGFVNIYKCGVGSLTMLGDTLFPDVSASTDVWTAIVALSDSIWNSKLIDYVISVHMIPCDVPAGNDEDIKVGTRTLTGIRGAKVTSDYVEKDLGTIKIDEAFTNFADFQTRCRLFLPFYGYVEIKPEFWQSAELNVKYRFNVVDGSFIASVYSTVTRHQSKMYTMVGQYSGCACIHCPVSGVSYASMFGGMVSNAGGMAASMATGNVGGVAASALNAAQLSQGNMQMSNPYNASASIMGHRYPYIIIERPVPFFPKRYGKEKGYPLLKSKTISLCKGFTIAEDIILDGVPATKDELDRIKTLFKSGVIIKS